MSYKSSINTGLPNIPDPPDPAFFAEFSRLYNAIRNLTIALDTYTGTLAADKEFFSATSITSTVRNQNLTRVYVKFGVDITVGKIVNLYDVSGTLTARLSDASSGKQMHGWCTIAATIGNYGEIMLEGLCTSISGLTPGTIYYLGNTPGTIATTAGTLSQKLGFALSASSIYFRPELK